MDQSRGTPRKALVTGGASGIGYSVAEALLKRGVKVAIGDVDHDNLFHATQQLRSNARKPLGIELDVTSKESVDRAIVLCNESFGGLDTLVNCAGIICLMPLTEISEEDWDRVIDVDLKGVFLCSQAAAPLLIESGRGRIVNVSSDAGKKGYPLLSSYCAAKFGVIGLSKAMAGELAPFGVTVNCVCPIGVMSTKMGQQVLEWLAKKTGKPLDKILSERARSTPLGRMATTDDVVNAILFFISDEAGFLTGEALNIDGGMLSTTTIPGIN